MNDGDDTERRRVRDWRFLQLVDAGYDPVIASVLADEDTVDLHRAVEMRSQGCDDDTALRILV